MTRKPQPNPWPDGTTFHELHELNERARDLGHEIVEQVGRAVDWMQTRWDDRSLPTAALAAAWLLTTLVLAAVLFG